MGCGSSRNINMIASHNNINKEVRPPIQINGEILNHYLELEHSIHEFEKRHVLENYQIKTEQLEQLEQAVDHLERDKRDVHKIIVDLQGQIGLSDFKSVKSVREFVINNIKKGPLPREEEKLLDSLNQQEIFEKELETLSQQKDNLKQEIEQLMLEGEKMQQLYQRRDELLDTIFEGQYGSETENQLEKELDWLLEQKHHVDEAHFRWKQALLMVKQSNNQLSLALQKLRDLDSIPEENFEKRYLYIAEVRNYLVATSQNLQGAQRYLPNISLPYCTPEEVDTLDKAISFIFTDMQTPERQEHALECYQTTHKRASALGQWLEHVLNTTIVRDLFELTEECKSRAAELRGERIRLIRKRIKEITGKDADFEGTTPNDLRDSGVDSELEDSAAADEQIAQIFEANKKERKGAKSLTPDPTNMPLIMPTPIPSAELAPMPTTDEIFGKIEQLRNRHKREMQEFQKTQRLNQARMTQGLKAKLHARRSRRSRLEMHRRELEALRESPNS